MADRTEVRRNPIWTVKVGFLGIHNIFPTGADLQMREAVEKAFKEVTGFYPAFVFSGWGGELTESELAVVENRLPREGIENG